MRKKVMELIIPTGCLRSWLYLSCGLQGLKKFAYHQPTRPVGPHADPRAKNDSDSRHIIFFELNVLDLTIEVNSIKFQLQQSV
jgi:hypothetical protein